MVDWCLPLYLQRQVLDQGGKVPNVIELAYVQLDETQGNHLGSLIDRIPVLKKLSIRVGPIHTEAMNCLAEHLKEKHDLEVLELIKVSMDAFSCVDLSRAIPAHTKLMEMNISRNPIGTKGLCLLFPAIPEAVKTLNLRDCQLAEDAGIPISGLLRRLGRLENLDLSENRLKDSAVRQMSWALKSLSHLHTLSLSAVQAGESCTAELSQALSSLSSLTHLDLSRNNFPNDSAVSLMKFCTTLNLRTMNFRSNPLSADCLYLIASNVSTLIPALALDLEVERWTWCKDLCERCGGYCLRFQDICCWKRRRVFLYARAYLHSQLS